LRPPEIWWPPQLISPLTPWSASKFQPNLCPDEELEEELELDEECEDPEE